MVGILIIICTGLGLLIGAMLEHAIIGGVIGFIVGCALAAGAAGSVGEGIGDAFDGFGDLD